MPTRNQIVPPFAAALSMMLASAAFSQDDDVVSNISSTRGNMTKQARKRLAPVVNPLPVPDTSDIPADRFVPGPPAGAMGKRGLARGQTSTRDFGDFGIPYTTTRVQLGNQSAEGTTPANLLSTSFPYRAIGKLTFSEGYCSASLIRRSVIVTAAHCIQPFGNGSSTFSGYQFWPGHYAAAGASDAQVAPYGVWNWAALVRPSSWANGKDIGDGAARDNDLAVIALSKNPSGEFIGDLVGWLNYGWNNYSFVSSSKTGNIPTAAVSTLGYPFLMDGGAIMQRTDGPTYTTTIGGAGQLWQGSNFTGGSSGGPWIVNFKSRDADLAGGATPGSAPALATVVGVTSWGSADPNGMKDNYASQFRQNARYPKSAYGVYGAGNIAALLNRLCSSSAPGGGTYASQGYCN